MLIIKARRDDRTTEHGAGAPGDRIIIDIDSFDDARLDQLLVDEAIEAPDSWANWSPPTKIAWLKLQFGSESDATPAARAAETTPFTRAHARGSSKVSLMTSLAALANPIEGKAINGEDAHGGKRGAVAAWPPRSTRGKGIGVAEAGEIGQPDPLHLLVQETERLNEREALGAVGKLANQSEVALFRLGGVLAHLKANGWHKAYGSFKAFVEAEHAIPYRKATHWMAVYRDLAQSRVAWEKVQTVGWSKLKEIASVVTPDNVDEWVKIALENTTRRLVEIVADHKKAGAQQAIARQSNEQNTADVVTRMTFRVHSGQKGAIQGAIEKAKTQAGTPIAAVALEQICANYLSGATFNHEAKALGLEACLRIIEEAYPNTRLKVAFVEAASQAA